MSERFYSRRHLRRSEPIVAVATFGFDRKEASLQELGERMGFPAESARKSAWQFLKCKVPRLDTLRRFSDASGIPIEELVLPPKNSGRKKKAQP